MRDTRSPLYIDCKRPRQNHRPPQGVPNLASDEVITTFYSGVVEDLIAAWDALPGKNFLYFIGSLQAIIVFLLISNKLIMTNILKNENCQFMLPATAILLLATYLQYTIGLARLERKKRIYTLYEVKRIYSMYDVVSDSVHNAVATC